MEFGRHVGSRIPFSSLPSHTPQPFGTSRSIPKPGLTWERTGMRSCPFQPNIVSTIHFPLIFGTILPSLSSMTRPTDVDRRYAAVPTHLLNEKRTPAQPSLCVSYSFVTLCPRPSFPTFFILCADRPYTLSVGYCANHPTPRAPGPSVRVNSPNEALSHWLQYQYILESWQQHRVRIRRAVRR